MGYGIRPVDVEGMLSVYYGAQDRRARQIANQRDYERQERQDQRDRDFDDAYGRFVGSGALGNVYRADDRQNVTSGDTGKIMANVNAADDPVSFVGGLRGGYGNIEGGERGLAAMVQNRPAKPAGALTSASDMMGGGAAPLRGPIRAIDPSAAMDAGAPDRALGSPENILPPAIQRLADSPNMDDRNAAFQEMARIDPKRAFQIQSDLRDAALDRLKGGQEALRIAASRLASTNDDNSYRAVLADLDVQLMPLGIDISKTVPPAHPGPQGIRQLQMLAMKEAEQLAALDREYRTEAMIANYDADNERADRNAESMIAEREARTGIARDRAETYRRREERIGSKPPSKGQSGGGAPKTAVNPKTGERLELRNGKWVPAAGGASGNAGGGFR